MCFFNSRSNSSSDGELSLLEVGGSLGGSSSHKLSLMLGESSSVGLGALVSEIAWSVLGLLVLLLSLISLLLVDDGKNLGNGLSDNL